MWVARVAWSCRRGRGWRSFTAARGASRRRWSRATSCSTPSPSTIRPPILRYRPGPAFGAGGRERMRARAGPAEGRWRCRLSDPHEAASAPPCGSACAPGDWAVLGVARSGRATSLVPAQRRGMRRMPGAPPGFGPGAGPRQMSCGLIEMLTRMLSPGASAGAQRRLCSGEHPRPAEGAHSCSSGTEDRREAVRLYRDMLAY